MPLGLALHALAGRVTDRHAGRQQVRPELGQGKVRLSRAVVIGIAEKDVLVACTPGDAEEIDDIGVFR